MTAATLATATSAENRKAVIAGTIGNVLEWYDFGVYGYLATTMSQLFFPGEDKTISLLKTFAVFGVGFVMRPVGSVVFGIYGDRFGRRLALSAVIFLMAFSTVAIGLLPTYAQGAVHRGLPQVSPRGPDHLRTHAAQHRRLLHTDHLHDQLHRVCCKAGAVLGAVDRHNLPAGLRDFDPDLGRIVRPDWPQAAAAALLRRLYHPRLSALHDGVLGQPYAGVGRPDGNDRISVILFRRMPRSLFRTPPDPRALHRLVNRLQHRGGGFRRLRALHRDLADRCDRQQLGTVLLSHCGRDDHVPRRAQNPRDGV